MVVAANATSHFIGRPGTWHSQVVVMDEGPGGRHLAIKGTGEVELRTTWGEIKSGYVPIPQVHRINAVLIDADFVALNLPPVHPGTPQAVTVAVTNGQRQQVVHTLPPGMSEPRFDSVRSELYLLIDELFPRSEKKPGLFKRLFGSKSGA
ncbi:MAG: hypothetical protein KJO07_16880 [Deltaproteobacteria bacterium]|nr:hypothetical protein [Deltaproteobacteria bacterium]